MDADRLIRKMMHIKRGDTLPYKGWSHDYTRRDLHKIFAELGYTQGAEIGVSGARHAAQMLNAIPDLHLTLVDPWVPYFRYNKKLVESRYAEAIKRMKDRNVTVMKMPSIEAAPQVEDGGLDFVYIDGDHRFDAVMIDIILWAPKVRRGGIVAGHDYYHFYQSGVVDAVRAYVRAHNINSWYITWEKEASWFWVQKERHGN